MASRGRDIWGGKPAKLKRSKEETREGKCRRQLPVNLFERNSGKDLNNIEQSEWCPFPKPLVVDSGAGETVMPKSWFVAHEIRDSPESLAKYVYTTVLSSSSGQTTQQRTNTNVQTGVCMFRDPKARLTKWGLYVLRPESEVHETGFVCLATRKWGWQTGVCMFGGPKVRLAKWGLYVLRPESQVRNTGCVVCVPESEVNEMGLVCVATRKWG